MAGKGVPGDGTKADAFLCYGAESTLSGSSGRSCPQTAEVWCRAKRGRSLPQGVGAQGEGRPHRSIPSAGALGPWRVRMYRFPPVPGLMRGQPRAGRRTVCC